MIENREVDVYSGMRAGSPATLPNNIQVVRIYGMLHTNKIH